MELPTAETLSMTGKPLLSPADLLQVNAAVRECSQGAHCTRVACPRNGRSADGSGGDHVRLRLLLVEDNPADIELELAALRKEGFDISADIARTAQEFTSQIRMNHYDLVLAGYYLRNWRGTEALDILCRENLDVPLIVVTGYLAEESAMDYVKQGAADCVLKGHLARLPSSVCRALEEKRLRDQRRQSDQALAVKVAELARSNAELEQFAYVASHDLQEPLRMIANYTQLLAERYRGQLDDDANKYIAYSVDGAVRMQTLIQDLMKYSRLGQGVINPQTIECGAVLEQAVKNLQVAIAESGAIVKWNGLPTVMADLAQLTQVFQNLIANAVKFRGAESPVVQIEAEKREDEWVFAVSDNGLGIPVESWESIFVIFRRLHTHAEYAGNGIGLAICKKIIERHGGKIWIEAQPQPGCCFKFSLPAEPFTTAACGAHA
jgi:signal transduction histidine kinase